MRVQLKKTMRTDGFAYGSLVFTVLLLVSRSYAAPHPATASSALTAPEKGIFFSWKGFRLGTQGTGWSPQEDHSLNQGQEGTSWRFSNSKTTSAQAHLKIDELKVELSLENYARRWMKDYSQLGMDVLGTRPFSSGNTRGIVIDLIQPKKNLQLRQAVFLKRKSVVILTCSDDKANFRNSLSECNELIKNFSWNELPSAPVKN